MGGKEGACIPMPLPPSLPSQPHAQAALDKARLSLRQALHPLAAAGAGAAPRAAILAALAPLPAAAKGHATAVVDFLAQVPVRVGAASGV